MCLIFSYPSRPFVRLNKADSEELDVDFDQIVDDVDNLFNEQLTMVQSASPFHVQTHLHNGDQPHQNLINSSQTSSLDHHHPHQMQQHQVQLVQPMTSQQQVKLPQVQVLQTVRPHQQLNIVQQTQGSQLQQLKLVQQVNQLRLLQPMIPPQAQFHLVQHPSHQLLQQRVPQQQLKIVQSQQQVQQISSSHGQPNFNGSPIEESQPLIDPNHLQSQQRIQPDSVSATSTMELANSSKVSFVNLTCF